MVNRNTEFSKTHLQVYETCAIFYGCSALSAAQNNLMKVVAQQQSCRKETAAEKSGGGKETLEDHDYLYYNSVYNMLEMFSRHIKTLFIAKEFVP